MTIRPVHQNLFYWNFQKCKTDLCYILIDKQMLKKMSCSNIASSLSSRNHLFYKAVLHETELHELGFGHNFQMEWTSDLK